MPKKQDQSHRCLLNIFISCFRVVSTLFISYFRINTKDSHLPTIRNTMATTTITPPYADEYLAAEALAGGRFVLTGSVQDIRNGFDATFSAMKNMLPPPGYEVSKQDTVTPDGVHIRVYTPIDLPPGSPTGLYIHSGGWSCGSIDHEDHISRHLALQVPCRLVSVEYKLAPENPFPAGLEDCLSAWKWMVNQETFAPNKFFVVGGSAGGNLALTTALSLLDSNPPLEQTKMPRAVFALCPGICMVQAMPKLPPSLRPFERPDAYGDSAAINKSSLETCGAAYIGSNDPANPLISPIFHPRLKDLPFVYFTTSNKDPANDEAKMLRHRLEELKVESVMKQYDGYPHFFHMLPMLKMTQTFYEDLAGAVRERCS